MIVRRFAPSEVDLGWAAAAGVDPLALVERLGPRVLALHLKDIDRSYSPPPQGRRRSGGPDRRNSAGAEPRRFR